MKNLTMLILGLTIFIRCQLEVQIDDPKDIEIGTIENYDFENDIKVKTVGAAMSYVISNIKYKRDDPNYWQLPEETYKLKTGDCEDFAIMLMYIMDKMNLYSELAVVNIIGTNVYHAMVYYPEKNVFIDATDDQFIGAETVEMQRFKIIYSIPYDETIWMTYYYHISVGKYTL